MSARCPAGHETASEDYCDVCGLPVGAPSIPSAATSGGAAAVPAGLVPPPLPGAGKPCPHCSSSNVADALFCEDCGYDFTTGAAPREEEAFGPDPVAEAPGGTAGPEAGEPDAGAQVPDAAVQPAAVEEATPAEAEAAVGPLESPDAPLEAPDVVAPVAPPAVQGQASPAPPAQAAWVAEVWVDPDWYALQGSSDPCPSAGPPAVVVLRERSVLVGRTSVSRNIHPQIDISSDPGVSRRHAQLSTDGRRWFVEDLQSANGTYIGVAGAPLPEIPLDPGHKEEIDGDDRVYLGAWTRIVLRQAAEDELS